MAGSEGEEEMSVIVWLCGDAFPFESCMQRFNIEIDLQ
jgi:hypothetical protein